MIYSPCSIDPDSTFTISRINDIAIVVCCEEEHIDYYYLYLTRLNCFTISHYGSYSCLPTLKPYLTTSAPRLTNGSLLEITMLDSHQLYIKHRTGAPSFIYYTVIGSFSQLYKTNFYSYLIISSFLGTESGYTINLSNILFKQIN